MSDARINAALLRLQAALAGVDVETALNALSYQTGILSMLGGETKGDALACVRASQEQARKLVNDCWGRADIELMRSQVRTVQ